MNIFGSTLLGIPLALWGIGCLAIAIAYYRIWPQPSPKRTTPRSPQQGFVLRYFHALVWVLLALGCFLAGYGFVNIGLWLAAAALPVYIVFLVMLVKDRNRELADLAAQRKAAQGATPAKLAPGADAAGAGGTAESKRPSGSVSK
jgi:hypothetical protein